MNSHPPIPALRAGVTTVQALRAFRIDDTPPCSGGTAEAA
jgi:hypothetical protein